MKRENAKRIKRLREKILQLNQSQFAARIPVAPSRVSEWEAAKRVPSAEHLYRLGSISPNPEDARWFWKQAGLDDNKIVAAYRKITSDRLVEATPLIDRGKIVLVPRYRHTAQGLEYAGAPLLLPAECIPNPGLTICLFADEKTNLNIEVPRGLFILDRSYENAEDLSDLWERVVMLQCAGIGEGAMQWPAGLYAGRLTVEWKPFSQPDAGFIAHLEMLTAGQDRGYKAMPVGIYTAIGASWTGLGGDELSGVLADAKKRARSEMRLEKGLRILGKVIGRLTGHLK